jgi:hypothetical protein
MPPNEIGGCVGIEAESKRPGGIFEFQPSPLLTPRCFSRLIKRVPANQQPPTPCRNLSHPSTILAQCYYNVKG